MIYGDPIILGRGGSGGPTAQDAILLATVPAGSTVSATKNGATVTPTLWVSAADSSLETALFVFTPAQFDGTTPWTITATDGTDTSSDTVLVATNEEYEVELLFTHYLYRSGNQYTNLTGGWVATKNIGRVQFLSDRIRFLSPEDNTASFSTVNAISTWEFNTLYVKYNASRSDGAFRIGIRSGAQVTNEKYTAVINKQPPPAGDGIAALTITGYQGDYYVGSSYWSGTQIDIFEIWLE